MFKIFNPETKKVESVEKIDYKKHWHNSGVPFEREEPETEVIAETVEKVVEKTTKKKKK